MGAGIPSLLKYFELEARFPRREDIPRPAVEFMAGQVKVDAALFAFYDFTSRTAVNHRAQVREYHQFQEPTVGDEDKLTVWLASDICPTEISRERLRTALLTRTSDAGPDRTAPGRRGVDVRAAVHRDHSGPAEPRGDREAGGVDRRRRPGGRTRRGSG